MVTNTISRLIENPHNCPVTRAMSIIGGKWKPIILNCIGEKSLRFGKLRQYIPAISNKVLSNELKELEQFGLIERIEYKELPPRVEYHLTQAGRSLLPILHEIARWGKTELAIEIIEKAS
ncbi:transcriptional regulator [Sandaracinomonas limnophila]|uniref:Transcriptional regulator n=1 Tax=Sandaracinomonas limnophila TaxID=1862386 RepID=A0A437PP31_9BACT|nr:helix-turn-helix domain-containing protein [Sandaracinomonas limnophila]RVU24052.1 transcriptional regulator [Sandaracinomonas limnophila]